MSSRSIGLDIGGTHIKAVLVDVAGVTIARTQLDTGDANSAWKEVALQAISRFEREHGAVEMIGVSCPGIARPDGSGISWMIGRMSGLMNFDFTAHLRRDRPVPVLNDGHAALLGEAWIGAARGLEDVVLITLGTGVGGAILSSGKLLKGHIGRAGHVGHLSVDASGPLDICNTPGSIEHYIGNYSLAARSSGRFSTTAELVEAARAGDLEARSLWLASIRKLAAAISSIVNLVDPQRVIVGGGMIHAGAMLFDPLRQELERVEWRPTGTRVELVAAELGEWAGAIGAARNAAMNGAT